MAGPTSSSASRLAVVGTAGHIDHGKTALVRRLTGVDTDRLPEEKARGISIDLGFAPLVTPAGIQVGIVDAPGHERFVKNMLAGVGGIDLVLLVIAADEGVMPQTREHLAIVQLLGVRRAVVVLTKADLVERDWIEVVTRDVRRALAGTPLAEAPIVEFSAVDGRGQEALLAILDRELQHAPGRSADAPARLPVDRAFVVEGFGTVVTGTLWRGAVRAGDTLEQLPARRAVRVRRVQVHGQTVPQARAGQRTALALHGVEREQVARGDWLVAPGSLVPSRVLDVRFELLPDTPRPWPARSRVRFHLGAGEHLGRLVLLEGTALAPGKSALAQVLLERESAPARGDRFVIRSYSPSRTVGGGSVIEPVARPRRRRQGGLEALAVDESGSLEARLLQRLAREESAMSAGALASALAADVAAVTAELQRLRGAGKVSLQGEGRWLAGARWEAALASVEQEVSAYALRHPARFGIAKGELKSGLRARLDPGLFDAAFDELMRRGRLLMEAERVRPSSLPWQPPAATLAALDHLEVDLEAAGFAVPENAAWQARLGAEAPEVGALGHFLGRLVRVSQELTYTARQLDELRRRLQRHFAAHPHLDVAAFKQLAGVSRKYAVPLLEHADRSGWTVRKGDVRTRGGRLVS
jgi:selenocysteine-specific elongation factor